MADHRNSDGDGDDESGHCDRMARRSFRDDGDGDDDDYDRV